MLLTDGAIEEGVKRGFFYFLFECKICRDTQNLKRYTLFVKKAFE